jgi:hypothetical protein
MTHFLIRFDDIHPCMNWEKFTIVKKHLESNHLNCILGVIPDNKDKTIAKGAEKENFFRILSSYQMFGDTIAQHGYQHLYETRDGGILNINQKSEFAGLDYSQQFDKLKNGKRILEAHGIWEPVFMAPAHSYDHTTLKCLSELGFKYITDGYALLPFEHDNLIFIPQLFARPSRFIPGLQTICLHTDTMNESQIKSIINFISYNSDKITCLDELMKSYNKNRKIYKNINRITQKMIAFAMLSRRKYG